MTIITETLVYDGPGGPFEGIVAWPDAFRGNGLPAVLIAHSWTGQSEFEADKAVQLAKLGYIGFAMDLYGRGKRANSAEDAAAMMQAIDSDRPLLASRMRAALGTLRSLTRVDPLRTAAIGYCFGGKCVLDLARTGSDVGGIVSLHGVYDRPDADRSEIGAKILVLHGWNDPLAPPPDLVALADELTLAKADWQIHAFGRTGHAFTNPAAAMPEHGMFYVADADRRSWRLLVEFLEEIFDRSGIGS